MLVKSNGATATGVLNGYPAVVLEANLDKKLNLLSEIYSAYVRQDLSSLFTIVNINAFNQLVQLLALGIGNLLNLNTLTADLGISRPTPLLPLALSPLRKISPASYQSNAMFLALYETHKLLMTSLLPG